MNRTDCLSDLVTRARRYRMSRGELAQLDEHLSSCGQCRLTQQIGDDFDVIGGLQAGDDVRIATLADAIVRGRPGRGVRRARARRLSGIAAAVAFALFAAAGAYAMLERPPVVRAPVESALLAASATPREQVELVASTALRALRVDAPAPARPIAPARVASAPRPQGPSSPVAPQPEPVDSASVLYANANGERRRSHVLEAISLYDELERQYPASAEALASRVSLGRLLLGRGMFSEALTQLTGYLTAAPDGTLAPEALFGRARALQALGRKDDERAAWVGLLAKFPDSVYATQAHRRIAELR
jgi:tetratricopeptide (TPR) repeat protein